jgi:thymidine phosphorylase
MNREALHELVDRLPEPEILAAQRYLEYLAASPAYRAALSAPKDDEVVTDGDALAIEKARAELGAGRVVPHDEILREFGLG